MKAKIEKIKQALKSVRVRLFITLSVVILLIILFLILVNNFVFGQFYLFSKTRALKDVYNTVNNYYNNEENENYFSYDGVLFSKGSKKTLVKYPSAKLELTYTIPEDTDEIMEYAFSGCKYISVSGYGIKNFGKEKSQAVIGVHAEVRPVSALALLLEVVRLRAALLKEILRRLEILFLARRLVEAEKGNLNLLMAGEAAELSLSEAGADEIGVLLHDVEQLRLARRLIEGDRGLKHMPVAVELMALLQILPLVVGLLDGEVGVQIAVGLLGATDKRDELVRLALELLVGADGQRVGDGLKPLRDVAVLEDHAVELALLLARGNAEVLDRVALFRAGDLVAEDLLLVRDDNVHHQLLNRGPEGVVQTNLAHADGGKLLFHHDCSLLFLFFPFPFC